ncbi:MAG: hypothetical protein PHY93_03045 [Bacteriovorax sp.]|nr:hypothetical protein [Bacteriovorax sp.]
MKTKAISSNISKAIKNESLKSKDEKVFMIGPGSEVEFNLDNWNKVLDESERIFLDRQSKNQNPLSFLKKIS